MPSFLVDKSALARRQTRSEVREALDPLLLAGEVASCAIVDLEVLYSAASPASYSATAEALRGMPRAPLDEECACRALEVQGQFVLPLDELRTAHTSTLPDTFAAR